MKKLYLENTKLLELKGTIQENLELYTSKESWLGKELNITASNLLQLKVTNTKNRSADDLDNAIRLYSAYKDLPYTLASDQNYWTLLTHTEYWQFMRERWPIEEAQGDPVEFIKTRYFFGQKGMYRNGLSRLWWYVELTYDKELDDPYKYTKLLLEDQDLAGQTIENKFLSRNKVAMRALFEMLEYVEKLQEEGTIHILTGKQRRNLVRDIAKYFNLSGAVEMWDILSPTEAFDKLTQWVHLYLKKIGAYDSLLTMSY
ncbi:DUF6339 family protein [Litchfieldia sinesaloumensis]|uniref:DUF6339 family protein n=1 Tax=Litchfieldia sinesaloumensis TaxID=1926280 RepID=UPI000988796D|nr:DUF6339 family protein [Bacillus sinesaloumensis]